MSNDMRAALERIVTVLGPTVPACSGCAAEWSEALHTARAALAAQDAPQPAAEPPEWRHLKAYGYAPGGYMSKCHRCGQTPINMDKRAVTCRPCAEAMHAAAQAAAGSAEPVALHRTLALHYVAELRRMALNLIGATEHNRHSFIQTAEELADSLEKSIKALAAPQPPAAPTQAQVAPVAKRLTVDGVAQCLEHILRTQYSSTTAHELAIARAIETAFCRLNGLEVAP